jgi:hypothetical protein
MPPDPRASQIYRSSASNAAYGAESFDTLPQKAGYPPEGRPTLVVTKADIEKHYGGPIDKFDAKDPAAKARMQKAIVGMMKEAGVPPEVLGQPYEQFADKMMLANRAYPYLSMVQEVANGYPVSEHHTRNGFGNQLGLIAMPSKPIPFADNFAGMSGIPADKLPNLSAYAHLVDRQMTLVHEAAHLVQDPRMSVANMEADSDRKGAATDPALSAALMDARKLGVLHGVLSHGDVNHVTPLLNALEAKHGPDSPLAKPSGAKIDESAKALGDAVFAEFKKSNPGATKQDLINAGPQVMAPLVDKVMKAEPSPFAGKSPEVREMATLMGNQYLEAGAKFYPELRPLDPNLKTTATIAPAAVTAAPPLAPAAAERVPTITVPAMPMLAPPLPDHLPHNDPGGPSAQTPAANSPEAVAEAPQPEQQARVRPAVRVQAGLG